MRSSRLPLALLAACFLAGNASATDWLQFGYDQEHSGNNTAETAITLANVNRMVPLYSVSLPATVDSAPAFLGGVSTPLGVKDLLFVETKTGILIALDAVTGAIVWQKQPTTPANSSVVTQLSPLIDPDRQYVYGYGLEGKVHKYQVGDGTEITGNGWPQVATLKPSVEKGASALSSAITPNGRKLYVVSDGYIGDAGDYQGHITTIDLDSGAQNVFNVNCSDLTVHFVLNGVAGSTGCAQKQSGVWGRPGAIYSAVTNRVYIASGNGVFDASSGGRNFGDSVLALSADGIGANGLPLDSYTPTNHASLNSSDLDLGSASPVLLPAPVGSAYPNLAVQGGKDAKLRLINLDNMSGAGGPTHIGGELQLLNVPQGGQVKPQPASWVDGNGSTWLFVASSSGIAGLQLTLDGTGQPSLVSRWTKTGSTTSPVLANGVLFHLSGSTMVARNPVTGDALWTSPTVGSPHWQSPIVVNGRIYVTNNSGSLFAFVLDPIFINGFETASTAMAFHPPALY